MTGIRYKFNSYNQAIENIDKVEHRITLCDYGQLENALLCDRLVCGVKDHKLTDKVLQTPNLELDQCKEICRRTDNGNVQLNSTSQPRLPCRSVQTHRSNCGGLIGRTWASYLGDRQFSSQSS